MSEPTAACGHSLVTCHTDRCFLTAPPVPGDRDEPTNGSDELRSKAITAMGGALAGGYTEWDRDEDFCDFVERAVDAVLPLLAPPGETWTEYRVVAADGSVPKGYDSPLPKLENAQYRASDLTWKDSLNENYGRTVPDGRPYRVQSSTVARTAWTDVEADPTEEP